MQFCADYRLRSRLRPNEGTFRLEMINYLDTCPACISCVTNVPVLYDFNDNDEK